MNARDILRHIDEGANHFLRTLAAAPHRTCMDAGGFTVIRPREGQEGVLFVCGLQLEGCTPSQWRDIISRAKATGLPVWFPLLSTDEQFACFFGRERIHGAPLAADDEVYMALFPHELTAVVNAVLSDGRPDLHPTHHLPLMKNGQLHAYVLYFEGTPVSAAVTMCKDGVASLEFVATLPTFRCRGYADAVCRQAVQDALNRGARLVTVRAVNAAAARLYSQLGFRAYNHAL